MTFFTVEEWNERYSIEFGILPIRDWQIECVSEMIYSQIGLRYRENWDSSSVPKPIKNASMEQMRFMLEHDIPFVDSKEIKSGTMEANLNSDYSTLALRILANYGYLYRGSPINENMAINIPFGGC